MTNKKQLYKILFLLLLLLTPFYLSHSYAAGLSKSIDIAIIKAELKSITFTSDHGVLKNNKSDWTDSGTLYGEPEWVKNQTPKPITHTKGTNITIEVVICVTPKDVNFEIIGNGSAGYVTFKNSDTSEGIDQIISITSEEEDVIPDAVDTLTESINWKLKLTDAIPEIEMPMDSTGSHVIYVTYGTPAGGVTEKRVIKAIELTAPHGNNPHNIVKGIMSLFDSYNLEKPYLGNIWPLSDNISDSAECQAIVRFVQAVIDMVGVPGASAGIVVYASPSAPNIPIIGSLGPSGGSGGMEDFALQPVTNYRAYLFDGDDNANNYEAALQFSYNGTTKFYPGGVGGAALDTTLEVLHTFEKMAWADWDVILNKWVPVIEIISY